MPHRTRRRQPRINTTGFLHLIAVVIAFCWYVFSFVPPPGENGTGKTPSTKEASPTEPVPTKVDYTSVCRQITKNIEEFFRNEGVPLEEFRIQEQRPVEREGKRWLFTKATVFFPRSVEPRYAAGELARALENDETLSFQWKMQEDDSCAVFISTNGVPTHVVTIMRAHLCLAIIIDDVGNDIAIAEELLELGVPLTLSILPGLPYSKQAESLAQERGYEVMLHLPMEPRTPSAYPLGKSAILHDMEKDEVIRIVTGCLRSLPHVKGVNNHMGSLVTEDKDIMAWVMEAIAPHNLYFIDSRTSSQSVAHRVAADMGVPSAKNYVFFDNEPEVAACRGFLDQAIRHVREEGTGIAIGHARRTTLHALEDTIPEIRDSGIRLVFVSELLKRQGKRN